MKTLPSIYDWRGPVHEPPMLVAAVSYLGLREVPGAVHNKVILDMAAALGRKAGITITDDETPWCGTFMGAVCQAVGGVPPNICVRARSWLEWGEPVGQPYRGDVLILSRPGGAHVCQYLAEDKTHYYVVGGNQSNSVSVTRIPKALLLGARRMPGRAAERGLRRVIVTSIMKQSELTLS